MYFNWGMKYINDIESYEAFKQEYLEDEKVNRMKSSVVLLCFVLVLTVFFQEAAAFSCRGRSFVSTVLSSSAKPLCSCFAQCWLAVPSLSCCLLLADGAAQSASMSHQQVCAVVG